MRQEGPRDHSTANILLHSLLLYVNIYVNILHLFTIIMLIVVATALENLGLGCKRFSQCELMCKPVGTTQHKTITAQMHTRTHACTLVLH